MNASTEARLLLCIAGLMLLDATIGGAVASHVLTNLDERSLRSFDTAIEFEFFHSLGLIGVVLVAERVGANAVAACGRMAASSWASCCSAAASAS